MLTAGQIGFNIACMSFTDAFSVSITSDDNILADPRKLCTLIEYNIVSQIKKHGITPENMNQWLEKKKEGGNKEEKGIKEKKN